MALVVNNRATTSTDNSGIGMILGIVIALLVIVLLAIYGIPLLKRQTHPTQTSGINLNIQIPNPIPSSLRPTPAPTPK